MIAKILIGCSMVALLVCLACCRLKPDGGFYWWSPPVTTSGDGLSYDTAYRFHHVDSGYLVTAESSFIRDKYWVTPQRKYEDFYHSVPPATVSCDDSIQTTVVTRDKKIYHVITFALPEGSRTLYFDVTAQRKNQ
jgi:hypothetical protein